MDIGRCSWRGLLGEALLDVMSVAALGAVGSLLVPFDSFGPRGEGVAQRGIAFARTSTPLRKRAAEATVAPRIY